MSKKFFINALIVVVVGTLLSNLSGSMMQMLSCLVVIGLTIFMYKNYADSVEDRTVLTILQGLKFGLLVGIMAYVVSIGMVTLNTDSVREKQIDSIESMRGIIGEEATEKSLEQANNMTDSDIITQAVIFGLVGSFLIYGVSGLIAGAIFKYDEDEAN